MSTTRFSLNLTARTILVSLAVCTVLVGAVYAAANMYHSQEAEFAARTGNASVVADSSASGSSAIKFGSAATGACAISGRLTVTSINQADYPAYPVNTKVYVPDGADPWGGCFPGPSNTGVPAGTQLTNYTGSCTITTANTVIDKKTVNCEVLDIRALGVIITNSQVNGRVYVDTDRCSTASFTIRDSNVHTADKNNRALRYCNYVAERVNLSGGGSMAECINCTIRDSYLHDPLEDLNGKNHNSTVRAGGNSIIEHNTLHCAVQSYDATDGSGESSGCSGNQTGYSHDATVMYNSTLRRNLYMGTTGGYCAWGGSTGGAGAGQVKNIKFIENIFQRGTTKAYNWNPVKYICGLYGSVANLELDLPGNEFTGNMWDNGKPLISSQWGDISQGDACGGAPAQCTW